MAAGDSVEWFAASFPGAASVTRLDGIRVVRAGRQWTVHIQAIRHYRGRLRGRFDAVIDEVNTVPFFTPLWAGIPRFLLIHQLAREVWWYESPFPVNAVGFAAEPLYLRLYRSTPAFAVSPSTISDLHRLGFRAPVTLVPEGLEPINVPTVTRPSTASFIYVGRLAPSKRVHDVLTAFAAFARSHPDSRLGLVGDGAAGYTARLRHQALRLGIEGRVDFWGRLDADAKHRRMAMAHALLMTSVREGWGLVVTEAAACGTPSIVYDVPGLRDAVQHEQTGLVVPPTPQRLAEAMQRLVGDPRLQQRLGVAAKAASAAFSWDRTAAVMRQAIERGLR